MEPGTNSFYECKQCKNIFSCPSSDEFSVCPVCGFQNAKIMETQLKTPSIELISNDQLSRADLISIFTNYIKPVRFRTPGLNTTELARNVRKIYQPFWLVDATASGNWTSTLGFDYQVESSREIYDNNQWISKNIEETRIDWDHRTGLIEREYHNTLVNSLSKQDWLTKVIGKYDFSKTSKFKENLIADSIIIPDITPSKGWQVAVPKFERLIQNDCQRAANAQHVKAFSSHIDYSSVNWTLLLAPYYHSYYYDDTGESRSVWINPQTKNIVGERVSSQKNGNRWGLYFSLASIFFLILGIIFASLSENIQAFQIFSAFAIIIFLFLFIFAGYSFIYPWLNNKKNQEYRFSNFIK